MIKDFQFGSFCVNESSKTLVIAEAAVEHLGNLNVAMRMADAAKDSGIDIIKYQMHIPDSEMLPNKIKFWGGSLDQILDDYNLTVKDHEMLIRHCEDIGIQYLCTPFCAEAVGVLNDLDVVGFKTGSGELGNLQLMEAISSSGKPAIISTGMSTKDDIENAVNIFKKNNCSFELMHCVSTYPMKVEDANLVTINQLKKEYNCNVGYSGHENGVVVSLAATMLGITSLERHITLDRTMYGSDQAASIEPKTFKELIGGVQKIEKAISGDKEKKLLKIEEEVAKKLRSHLKI